MKRRLSTPVRWFLGSVAIAVPSFLAVYFFAQRDRMGLAVLFGLPAAGAIIVGWVAAFIHIVRVVQKLAGPPDYE